jgi:hypothetical protein
MRQATITIYKFTELSDDAKRKVLDNWRHDGNCYFEFDDEMDSIKAFCDFFNVTLVNYEVGGYRPFDYKTNATNDNFRGRKLKDFSPDYMPKGYWLDCSLWGAFYKHFKETGDCKGAFDAALWEGFKDLQKEIEHRDSDEYLTEFIEMNEFEFNEDGSIA